MLVTMSTPTLTDAQFTIMLNAINDNHNKVITNIRAENRLIGKGLAEKDGMFPCVSWEGLQAVVAYIRKHYSGNTTQMALEISRKWHANAAVNGQYDPSKQA